MVNLFARLALEMLDFDGKERCPRPLIPTVPWCTGIIKHYKLKLRSAVYIIEFPGGHSLPIREILGGLGSPVPISPCIVKARQPQNFYTVGDAHFSFSAASCR